MRSTIQSSLKRGFTLIEILIVVVILGILAAIVIPQFTNASDDAQDSSVRSQLQTVRSQIELFNVQNPSVGYPDFPNNGWNEMLNLVGFENPADVRYLQQEPRNAMRANGTALTDGTDVPPAASGAGVFDPTIGTANVGWYWNTDEQIMYAIAADGTLVEW